MWPSQRIESDSVNGNDVSQCSSEIIALASDIIHRGQLEYRFIVFPLFIAGFATTRAVERTRALELITILEQESIGNNTRATRRLLQTVYSRQDARSKVVGHCLDVDWIEIMHDTGAQVVSFGL